MKGKFTDLLLYAAGVQYPVRLQCANGIEALFDKGVHNAEDGFSRPLGFLIYEVDDGAFEHVFQPGIVPFPFIEEMGNCSTVAGAVFFKINGFSMISKRKDGYQYGHDMFHGRLWKDPAQA